ncbi:MAG: sensor histidine kinase [Flavobacteriales bacterium]|nr:sensor histidine kinase [Flavobacteriales bacterium]
MRLLILPLLLIHCALLHAQEQPTTHARPLADTVQADVLIDSLKRYVGTGRIEEALVLVPELEAVIAGIRTGGDHPALLPRRLQATKLEGIAHYRAGAYPKALDAFQRFQQVAELYGAPEHIGAAHNYQSYQYREMNDVPRAMEASRKAIAILRTLPPGDDLANALSGLTSIASDQGLYDSAVTYAREAVAIYARTGNDMNRGSTLLNMTDAFIQQERYDSALACVKRAMPLVEAAGNPYYLLIAHGQHGRALLATRQYVAAADELGIAERMAVELEDDESLGRIKDLRALISAQGNDPVAAIRQLQDGRDALIRDLDLAKVQEITEVRLKAEHEQEQQLAAIRLAEERQRRHHALIGGALVLLIALLLAWLLIATRRKNAQIIRAQQQVVEVEKQHEAEQVRTRIARDIHDDIGSGLTKIAMLGSEARQHVQEHSEELRGTLERIIGHSREVNAALSDIVWSVDPAHDTSEELVHHARNVAQRLLEGSGVAHELLFDHIDPAHPVAPGTKHHVVMVMKEAINNALKYAGAKHINVHLEAGGHHVKLVIADDGKGFDPEAMARAGNGLRNMRARAEAIGVRLTLHSTPGHGCTVEFDGSLA